MVAALILLLGRSRIWAFSFLLGHIAHVLTDMGDTIGVMCRGELAAIRPRAEWTEAEIMRVATGSASDEINSEAKKP